MFETFKLLSTPEAKAQVSFLDQLQNANGGWGKRRLNRFKIKNGIKYQLHATRGWKKVGRVKGAA